MIATVTDLGEVRARAVRDTLERSKRLFVEATDLLIAAMDEVVSIEALAQRPMIDAEGTIDAHAVAEMLQRHVTTVRELARNGNIPCHRVPGTGSRQQILFYRSEIEAWIRTGRSGS